jgi:glycosyltransferase involved in cell wall biosynthesis
LGRTDGVSLEVDKWRTVLRRMGHEVFYIAGNDEVPEVHCVPELSLSEPLTYRILRNATVKLTDYAGAADLLRDIDRQAEIIHDKVLSVIRDLGIEVLIPNNLLSIGYNVPAVPALARIIAETRLPTIAHCHDFYFEDSGEVTATCEEVLAIYEEHAPPRGDNVQVIVINRLAQRALKQRKGIDARVVPNVFDFDQPPWQADEYNADFRAAAGLTGDDLMLLQATRILDRKGVELAIDVTAELNKPENRKRLAARPLYDGRRFPPDGRIALVCSGFVETFGISGDYFANLQRRAERRGVDVKFVGERVRHGRATEDGRKIYSLWDSYVSADFVTYPSLWEGWGNQFIEAVFARLPVVLFEYPVWKSDLAEAGFEVVSLGDRLSGRDESGLALLPDETLRGAADRIVDILTDADRYRRIGERNFAIARQRYSFQTLEAIIGELLGNIGL